MKSSKNRLTSPVTTCLTIEQVDETNWGSGSEDEGFFSPSEQLSGEVSALDFLLERQGYFCSILKDSREYLPLEHNPITEKNNPTPYAEDFLLLRIMIRSFFKHDFNEELDEKSYSLKIEQIFASRDNNPNFAEIIEFTETLIKKLERGSLAMLPVVTKLLLTHREFVLSPFTNDSTREELKTFLTKNRNPRKRYKEINKLIKRTFNENVLSSYHNAITGKCNYDQPNKPAATPGYKGLLDGKKEGLEFVLLEHRELMIFLYNHRFDITWLSTEFQSFLKERAPDKAIALLEDPDNFHLLRKICDNNWIKSIDCESSKIINKELIASCVGLNQTFRNTTLSGILSADTDDTTCLNRLRAHLKSSPRDSEFLVRCAKDIESLAGQYQNQKRHHWEYEKRTSPSIFPTDPRPLARKIPFGNSPPRKDASSTDRAKKTATGNLPFPPLPLTAPKNDEEDKNEKPKSRGCRFRPNAV